MNNASTGKGASEALAQVKDIQSEITKRSAKEYAPWVGWGLYFVLFYSPFDYVRPETWGTFCGIGAALSGLVTFWYVRKRQAGIKTIYKTPRYGLAIFGLWIAAGIVFASLLHPHLHFAWTIAGLAIGLPFIAYGLRLKSQT